MAYPSGLSTRKGDWVSPWAGATLRT